MVSDARSIHTKRWALALKNRGLEVVLFTLHRPIDDFFEDNKISLILSDVFTNKKGIFNSICRHIRAYGALKRTLKDIKPDILHAHYLSSYSFLASLMAYKNLVVSIWGSDIYKYPNDSWFNKCCVKYIFTKADRILSTSECMANEASKYTSKKIYITPFGVDTRLFKPTNVSMEDGAIVIGSVKTLSYVYGMDIVIEAFKLVVERNPDKKICLKIAGDGPDKEELIKKVKDLNLESSVMFLGLVPNDKLPILYNSLSMGLLLSRRESFGVVAVEAMACSCPVVVSATDGFKEVVEDSQTGYIVELESPSGAANAIQKLIDCSSLRQQMGEKARERVMKCYDWDENVSRVIKIYNTLI